MDTIKLIPRKLPGNTKERIIERNVFDIVINGKSLTDKLIEGKLDTIPVFGFYGQTNYELETIMEFMLEKDSDLDSERIKLFICRECGDVGCGAITVEIEKTDKTFKWNSFMWENGFEKMKEHDRIQTEPLEFMKSQYEDEFNKLRGFWL
ncbi:hypothetical protein M0G43_13680 [Subsaxibacter sp. CAU 1640]|uniref:hypothetical protein n=1 Tax=Subsaxibacter sp. CAU 1640 TaxID=2933271 RepID=UPI002004269C|nr:hypothetical protein [Subsaxibacter sp. CAU 1640]MCK7591633.1 hypothetical protein [Subsaxibacter sp. CAU 1640]